MTDEFDFLRSNEGEELPDWLEETSQETPASTGDEFDRLRERAALASEVYEEIERPERGGLRGFVSSLSPLQRFILVFLIFLNVLAFAAFLFVAAGLL